MAELVECARLEIAYTGNCIEGSNPPISAKINSFCGCKKHLIIQIMKILGRGSFGKVSLVQYKATGEYYAMKSLKKDVLLDQDQVESTILEKKILQSLDHPFLVGMIFCFQTVERIYFVMPFIRGGELFQHLREAKIGRASCRERV